jgi:hypothetical protein
LHLTISNVDFTIMPHLMLYNSVKLVGEVGDYS